MTLRLNQPAPISGSNPEIVMIAEEENELNQHAPIWGWNPDIFMIAEEENELNQHAPISGSDPDIFLTEEEEIELEEWYKDHYPLTHIRGGICHCIGDKVDSIIAWRDGDPDLKAPEITKPPPPPPPPPSQ